MCGHVKTLERALKQVEYRKIGIFDDDDFLCNVDERAVMSECGGKFKVHGSSDTHHGGSRAQSCFKNVRDLTAVVCVSASGRNAHQYFFGGKNVIWSRFVPLTHSLCGADSRLTSFTNKELFPKRALILTSENGIMEQSIIRFVVEQINLYVSRFLPQDKKITHLETRYIGWTTVR